MGNHAIKAATARFICALSLIALPITALADPSVVDAYREIQDSGLAPEKPAAGVIDNRVLEKERETDFKLNRVRRFRYRTRYFTDSGIIGTKEFVSGNYRRFKDLFMSKKEKIPKPVAGLDGIFSLKRLAES